MKALTESVIDMYVSRPTVAILMSGQGSNAELLLSSESLRDLYNIKTIVSDSSSSRAQEIAEKFSLDFVLDEELASKNPENRRASFTNIANQLSLMGITSIFYAGFMTISPDSFCNNFPGVNIHPANLSIKDASGLARYRGMNALRDMVSELGYAQSSVHIVDSPVDSGDVISISERLDVVRSEGTEQIHIALKSIEHVVYPRTLQLLGEGGIKMDQMPYEIDSGVYQ